MPDTKPDDELIPIEDVAREIKKSRAWLYVRENREALYAAGFPRPRNEAVLGLWWVKSAVLAWVYPPSAPPDPPAAGARQPANDGQAEVDLAAIARERMHRQAAAGSI